MLEEKQDKLNRYKQRLKELSESRIMEETVNCTCGFCLSCDLRHILEDYEYRIELESLIEKETKVKEVV